MREPLRFLGHELRGSRSGQEYRLRAGMRARVRHPLLDSWVLEEIFRMQVYEPPAVVAACLGALGRPPRIVDLGGHAGFFGLFALERFPGATLVSVEPDPDNARTLAAQIQLNDLEERWSLVEAAAAVVNGTTWFESSYHLSQVADTGREIADVHAKIGNSLPMLRGTALLRSERREVTTRDVFPLLDGADLVKIDIEGAEGALFADPRFGSLDARAVVLEHHFPGSPGAGEALKHAGYTVGTPEPGDGTELVWAWRNPTPAHSL